MDDTKKEAPRAGWGWPGNSHKQHYFYDGRSLCGKWGFFGDLNNTYIPPDNSCAACKKLIEKNKRGKGSAVPD